VPLGVFLSSGLDSTAIVAMMARLGVKPKTYTIGYEDGKTYNELEGARLVARKYGTEHHDCLFGPADVIKDLPAAVSRFAEPHGDWTYLAMGRLSRQSRPDITVALTGAGGDELFAGYPTLIAARFGRFYRHLPGPVKSALRAAAERLPVSTSRLSLDFKLKSFARGAPFKPELAHMKYKEILTPEEIAAFLPGRPGTRSVFSPSTCPTWRTAGCWTACSTWTSTSSCLTARCTPRTWPPCSTPRRRACLSSTTRCWSCPRRSP
jgi:asparagine synthase (glutamine-hydrolysing)